MTDVLLIRHGQSTWNADRRWQGRADPPLSPLGYEQARRAAARVGVVDAIVASPLERAQHTANLIADEIGVGPVLLLSGLVERDAGAWQGLTVGEIDAADPGAVDAGRWPEGWEPDHGVYERARGALDAVAQMFPGQSVLAVTHGGLLRVLIQGSGHDDRRGYANLAGYRLRIDAGELAVVEHVVLLDREQVTPAGEEAAR